MKRTKHPSYSRWNRVSGQSRRTGFSIFEVLIVVTILAILAAVAVPSFQAVETQSLKSVARSLATDLRLARDLSIQHNTNYTVRFDTANNAYEIIHTGTGTPPPLRNALAAHGSATGTYRIDLDDFAPTKNQSSNVIFANMALSNSNQSVTDVTFGPLGGTGPSRGEDTVIWLKTQHGRTVQSIKITISWVTGQAWLDDVSSL